MTEEVPQKAAGSERAVQLAEQERVAWIEYELAVKIEAEWEAQLAKVRQKTSEARLRLDAAMELRNREVFEQPPAS